MGVKFCFHLPNTPSPDLLPDGLKFKTHFSDTTVLLIHGLTGTPNEMKFLANYLWRQGYSVICPRLAYHGEPIRVLRRAKWQEFYQSVRDAISQIPPGQKIFTAGLSMGALLALLAAEEFADRVLGVSCLSPTLFYDGWNIPWTQRLLPLAYYTPIRYFAYFKEEPPYGIKNESIRRIVHEFYENASLLDSSEVMKYGYPYFPVTLLCELRLLVRHLKKILPRVHAPVQLVQAFHDDMTSVKNSKFIYDRVSSKKKEIVLLHDSYHVITADQERETVAKKLHEFLSVIPVNGKHQTVDGKEKCVIFSA